MVNRSSIIIRFIILNYWRTPSKHSYNTELGFKEYELSWMRAFQREIQMMYFIYGLYSTRRFKMIKKASWFNIGNTRIPYWVMPNSKKVLIDTNFATKLEMAAGIIFDSFHMLEIQLIASSNKYLGSSSKFIPKPEYFHRKWYWLQFSQNSLNMCFIMQPNGESTNDKERENNVVNAPIIRINTIHLYEGISLLIIQNWASCVYVVIRSNGD